jgi:hypothetical protein
MLDPSTGEVVEVNLTYEGNKEKTLAEAGVVRDCALIRHNPG